MHVDIQTSPPFPETESSCRPLLTSSQTYKHGHSPVELECPQQVDVEGREELASASFLLVSILEELEQHAEVKCSIISPLGLTMEPLYVPRIIFHHVLSFIPPHV